MKKTKKNQKKIKKNLKKLKKNKIRKIMKKILLKRKNWMKKEVYQRKIKRHLKK